MAHGQPDYGMYTLARTIYGLADMGELATRLWSPNTFDRRGNILWMDSFEGGLNKWIIQRDGDGAAAAITNEEARNGLCSCKLIAGSTATHMVGVGHFQAFPVLSSMGIEASWSTHSTVDAIQLHATIDDAVNVDTYGVQWVQATKQLEYYTAPGVWVAFATAINFPAMLKLFHTWKLVIDAESRQYRYLITDDSVYSLAGLSPDTGILVAGPFAYVKFTNVGDLGQNDVVYLDDVILTQNEP